MPGRKKMSNTTAAAAAENANGVASSVRKMPIPGSFGWTSSASTRPSTMLGMTVNRTNQAVVAITRPKYGSVTNRTYWSNPTNVTGRPSRSFVWKLR